MGESPRTESSKPKGAVMDDYRAQREAIIRAATDWVESVLEHGDPAMRSGSARFTAVVDDVLAADSEGAVDLIRAIREPIEDVYQDSGNWPDLRAVRKRIGDFLAAHGGR